MTTTQTTDTVTSRYVSRLSIAHVTHSCGHVVLRLMRNGGTRAVDCACEVCRDEMTPEVFACLQDSIRRHG